VTRETFSNMEGKPARWSTGREIEAD
jgi:hypothetical protein